MAFRIGKTRVTIEAEGCFRCGAHWSRSWHVVKIVPVKIGERELSLTIHACHECVTPEERGSP